MIVYNFAIMQLHKVVIFLSMCVCALAICTLSPDVNFIASMTCKHTSSKDFGYDIIKMHHRQKYSVTLKQLNIINSDFQVIGDDLFIPFKTYSSDYILENLSVKISFCGVTTITEAVPFSTISNLDLSFNEIEDLTFISYFPYSIRNLNLKNNKIIHIDFGIFNYPLEILDLSFNNLKEIDFAFIYSLNNAARFLNLDHNHITTVYMPRTAIGTFDFKVNLANNPLKFIKNCGEATLDDSSMYSSIELLNLSNSLTHVPVGNITRCGLNFRNLILSNNVLALDSRFDIPNITYERVDISNSSINHNIPEHIFKNKNMVSLNLSHNNLQLLTDPIFNGTRIAESLDLSNCKIKNVANLFQNLYARSLNLTANNISELNSNSFNKISTVFHLDLSFNNLTLKNNSFINCKSLAVLKLANSNISLVEDGTFNALSSLMVLNLNNNFLKSLPSKIFKPLLNIKEIYLESNKLTTIQTELFSSIPVSIVKLSNNKIELIKHRAFYDLSQIEYIEITNNSASLIIENNAFSELWSLNKVNLSNSGLRQINLNMFSGSSRIEIIDVKDNNITSIDFSTHNYTDGLEELQITLVGDLKSKSFLKLQFLKNLTCWKCKINTIERRAFQGLSNLKSLRVINSEIGVMENGALDGLFSLQHLNLDNSTHKNIAGLGSQDLISLTSLNLSSQGIQDIAPSAFKCLNGLVKLYLNNNNLSFFKDSTFDGLDGLKFLDLSYNRLNVVKSSYFRGLGSLAMLNLSNNGINDVELGAFQHFPNLNGLILRDNNLTEFKVGTFSNLYDLTILDLSRNSISTLLFELFLPLKSLTDLNLEFNNLKTFGQYKLISNLKYLRNIGIAKNKWKCPYLELMIVTFRINDIDYTSKNINFYDDNVEGIECIDICKYLLCLKDPHGEHFKV